MPYFFSSPLHSASIVGPGYCGHQIAPPGRTTAEVALGKPRSGPGDRPAGRWPGLHCGQMLNSTHLATERPRAGSGHRPAVPVQSGHSGQIFHRLGHQVQITLRQSRHSDPPAKGLIISSKTEPGMGQYPLVFSRKQGRKPNDMRAEDGVFKSRGSIF